jgi:hypothetical protein
VTTVFHGKGGESRTYETPVEYYETHETLHNYYERSLHADQPAYVAVLCEAAGMVPMIGRAVRNYRVEVASSSGFDSLTVKYDLFRDALYRYEVFGQKTILAAPRGPRPFGRLDTREHGRRFGGVLRRPG